LRGFNRLVEAGSNIFDRKPFRHDHSYVGKYRPKILRLGSLGDGDQKPKRVMGSGIIKSSPYGRVASLRDDSHQLRLAGVSRDQQPNDLRQVAQSRKFSEALMTHRVPIRRSLVSPSLGRSGNDPSTSDGTFR